MMGTVIGYFSIFVFFLLPHMDHLHKRPAFLNSLCGALFVLLASQQAGFQVFSDTFFPFSVSVPPPYYIYVISS